jgi:hypothetical protein
LIGTIQYSDTFTIGTDYTTGTRNGTTYTVGGYPISTEQAVVESAYVSNHSNTQPHFLPSAFSLNNDAHYVDVTTNGSPFYQTYPGSSNAGSASGFTQTGLGSGTTEGSGSSTITYAEDHGFAYGGSNSNFIVQADAVQVDDRIDINIGNTQDTVLSPDGLSVFFRASSDGATSLGLFNTTLGETDFTFESTNVLLNEWNNYAVQFDLATDTLKIYTNEVLDGTVNLATFDGGDYKNVLDDSSNAFVSVGGHVSPPPGDAGLLWTDNLQVGTPVVPEPGTWAMLLSGVVVLVGVSRLRRLVA